MQFGRPSRSTAQVCLFLVYLLHPSQAVGADDPTLLAQRTAQFEREIRPVLIAQCIQCHGERKQEGGLRLDTRDGILKGGESGPTLVEGKPEVSLIVAALQHRGPEMPPDQKLSNKTIVHFERWIAGGAVWPRPAEALRASDGQISETDRQWWAFQPVRKVMPSVDRNDTWSQNEVDRFVWQRLSDRGMVPAPAAEPATLIRRLYLTLVGVPPTPAQIDAFVADASPERYASLVDSLLDDVRYGEHWARFWLDLVRYSESDGWNQDAYRPQLWRYRDYVVRAFNRDLPYPRFVLDQLAGDEDPDEDPDGLIAAGFLRLGVYEYNQRDARGQWNDITNEITDVTGDVFLGLSLACARCHDHKFDPVPQRDYFKFRAFFEPVCWRDDLVAATAQQKAEHQARLSEWEKATHAIRQQLAELLEPYETRKWKSTVDKFPLDIQACFHLPTRDRTSWQEQMAYLVSRQYLEEGGGPYKSMKKEDAQRHEALRKELAEFDGLKPEPLPEAMTVRDFPGLLSPTVIPEDARRQAIAPGFLEVMSQGEPRPTAASAGVREGSSGRRTALARWIGDAGNPLTMRVLVNRIWQQHFGQGLVATSNDFGRLGEAPSHSELLDWLTATFIEQGFSLKALHRTILLSSTWRQSTRHPSALENQTKDPKEKLLWRARVRRLCAEQIRDAMLSASGELDGNVGGPSVGEDQPRRSLYLKSLRNQNDTFLHGFDMANGLQSVPARDTTTTPTQSLLLLNGKYALGRAEKLAARLLSPEGTSREYDADQVVRLAFLWCWGREPGLEEWQAARRFVSAGQGEDAQILDGVKLADLCHVLFNSSQFLYME
jgi:mono/diheme cytochrome c family protein